MSYHEGLPYLSLPKGSHAKNLLPKGGIESIDIDNSLELSA